MYTNLFTRFNLTRNPVGTGAVRQNRSPRKSAASKEVSLYGRWYEIHRNQSVDRLVQKWGNLLFKLGSLGTVDVETRNRGAVFRFTGCYDEFIPGAERFVEHASDEKRMLLYFLENWGYGLSAREPDRNGKDRRCLQILDPYGVLIHTIILGEDGNAESFDTLASELRRIRSLKQDLDKALSMAGCPRFNQVVDIREFRNRWLASTDHLDQIRLTDQYGISELQGLRLVGETWANQVPVVAIFERLALIVDTGLPCTLQISNKGTLQIRSGRVENMNCRDRKLILSGPEWHLSVRLSEIDSAWVVTKPAAGRLDSSIELYNRDGQAITKVFGNSESLEHAVWQDLLGTVPMIA